MKDCFFHEINNSYICIWINKYFFILKKTSVTSNHLTLKFRLYIVSNHIKSNHIKSNHIKSNHIISYQIISNLIIFRLFFFKNTSCHVCIFRRDNTHKLFITIFQEIMMMTWHHSWLHTNNTENIITIYSYLLPCKLLFKNFQWKGN